MLFRSRLRVPVDCRELSEVVAREHGHIHGCQAFGAEALVRLLERLDAFRKPQRLDDILLACECDARGRGGDFPNQPYASRPFLRRVWQAAASVDTATLAREALDQGRQGPAIAAHIAQARAQAVSEILP